jgi:hypothetical protein
MRDSSATTSMASQGCGFQENVDKEHPETKAEVGWVHSDLANGI